jgi:hypothetical protein
MIKNAWVITRLRTHPFNGKNHHGGYAPSGFLAIRTIFSCILDTIQCLLVLSSIQLHPAISIPRPFSDLIQAFPLYFMQDLTNQFGSLIDDLNLQ